MQDQIAKRLHEVLDDQGFTPNRLTTMSGITTAGRQLNGSVTLSVSLIVFIAQLFPDLSLEWLIRGEGPKYKTDARNAAPLINNDIRVEGGLNDSSAIQAGVSSSLESEVKFLRQLVQQLAVK